jgi:hypothetical protein
MNKSNLPILNADLIGKLKNKSTCHETVEFLLRTKELNSEILLMLFNVILDSDISFSDTMFTLLKCNFKHFLVLNFELINLSAFIDLFEKYQNSQILLKCWSFLLLIYNQKIHKTSYLNKYLQIAENCFNSTDKQCKLTAFEEWKICIFNLSFNCHLLNEKRINLILVPIWNCLKFENDENVMEKCLNCFAFLVATVSNLNAKSKRVEFYSAIIEPLLAILNEIMEKFHEYHPKREVFSKIYVAFYQIMGILWLI